MLVTDSIELFDFVTGFFDIISAIGEAIAGLFENSDSDWQPLKDYKKDIS